MLLQSNIYEYLLLPERAILIVLILIVSRLVVRSFFAFLDVEVYFVVDCDCISQVETPGVRAKPSHYRWIC